MFHSDLLFMRDNSNLGIYRPNGWPWNTGINNSNDTWWKSWVQSPSGTTKVDGVYNDCLYRSVHSSYKYSVCVFAKNPYRDFEITMSYERTYHYIWHNSWCNISVSSIEIDKYCKALIFYPSAGAGGGVIDVYKISANFGGRGSLSYEVCMGIANDSNNPVTGTGAWNYTANGKAYTYYSG